MKIDRIWAMPNKWTFKIEPISTLLKEEMHGGTWIDPYCGKYSTATITNDINPELKATYHEDALTFLNRFESNSVEGVLNDPPYSTFARKRYGGNNEKMSIAEFGSKQRMVRNQIANILKPNGKVITFGWNSTGIGRVTGPKRRTTGLKIERILLVNHSGWNNDTIVTVERKINGSLS